ncbi:MAG TPA: acylphosphatase [Erysipelotrichaceae bacterium]|nr:acylphosphatase [Erysipelotrichaceae bacterium]
MKRYHVIVEGRVQGVGFRGFCMLQAQRRDLTGTVKNLSNGMVEIFVQGDEVKIDEFLTAVQKGDRFIRVDDMSVKETAVVPNEKRFVYGW